MKDEKNIVEMTIKVDLTTGMSLDHTCARCGATAKSTPASLERFDRATGQMLPDDVFIVRSAAPPAGWDHIRSEGRMVEVCGDCIRKFLEAK